MIVLLERETTRELVFLERARCPLNVNNSITLLQKTVQAPIIRSLEALSQLPYARLSVMKSFVGVLTSLPHLLKAIIIR